MLMLMEILSNPLDIYMYFPSPIGIRGAIYIVLYRGGKKFLNRSCNREKKGEHSLNPKKKEKDRKRKEKREKRNSWLHTMPTSPTLPPKRYLVFVSCLCLFCLGFRTCYTLSYRHTDRSRPIFCLYLALTYMDLHVSRTELSVELDEIQNTDTMYM